MNLSLGGLGELIHSTGHITEKIGSAYDASDKVLLENCERRLEEQVMVMLAISMSHRQRKFLIPPFRDLLVSLTDCLTVLFKNNVTTLLKSEGSSEGEKRHVSKYIVKISK